MKANDLAHTLFDLDIKDVARVDPHAAAILAHATGFLAEVFRRRRELDERGGHDLPLQVVVGEKHDNPASKLFNTLLVKGVNREERRLAVGLEMRSYSSFACVTDVLDPKRILKAGPVRHCFNRHNRDGSLGLGKGYLQGFDVYTPYASKV